MEFPRVPALQRTLQRAYSAQLYGGFDRVPRAPSLKLIWLSLLDNATLVALPTICNEPEFLGTLPPMTANGLKLYAKHSWLYTPADSVWVYHNSAPHALPSGSWAEVTQCPSATQQWYYHAPGSGVSLNIGKSAVLPNHDKFVRNARLQITLRQRGFQSIQFLSHINHHNPANNYSSTGEPAPRHEILLLPRLDGRPHPSPVGQFYCGRHPWLRPCVPADAVVRLMRLPCCCKGWKNKTSFDTRHDARVRALVRPPTACWPPSTISI